ncbi:hypothetical protein TWF694_006889 [Orbilia ellipsospora]|uniref:DUF1479-domain-containing protein n=1 Tax=Orbilia ellipsospora TaxID=2528407 RepID=A0AAV9XLW5_9PEZI
MPAKTEVPGQLREWPAWQEYGLKDRSAEAEYLDAKRAVIEEYGQEKLTKGWIRVCEQLAKITEEIIQQGNEIIPVCSAETLQKGFSSEEEARIKKTGCVIVRGVIPEEEARKQYNEVHKYIHDNMDTIRAWPEDSPYMYELYDSPMQNAIRSHENHLKIHRLMNELWHDKSGETTPDPLIFYDGVRDRPPKQTFLGLGPHIDAGSLSRWASPDYRIVYDSIFSGNPEKHDAWNLDIRKDAAQDFFKAPPHSAVFRSFQGWTALTPSRAREGCILLYPNIQASIAYMVLRPFFNPPKDEADIMDATKWTFADSGCEFPGTDKEQSQYLSRSSHPHLRLRECLMHVPDIQPGDTVWWHTDLCHAVDTEHEGVNNSSVVFIPAAPSTARNKAYVKRQLADVLAGRQPSDFQGTVNEKLLKGYKGHEGFSEEARKAFGYYL